MFSKIMLALDGTDASAPAVEAVRSMEGSRSVYAVHVQVHAREPDQRAVTERQVQDLNDAGVHTHLEWTSSLVGEEAEAIAELARSRDADVIVAVSRGRSPITGAVLGSTTQQLLHVAGCPVLVVPIERTTDALETDEAAAVS